MVTDMRRSCQLAADCLTAVGEMIGPGVATEEIDRFVHDYTVSHGAYPSPLNYGGGGGRPPFPKSVCTSVNDCVCHGVPGPYVLKDGDIVNVDVTTYLPKEHGYHGDTSVTFYVGQPSDEAIHVVETARRCLELGLAEVKHGKRIGDIGYVIQQHAEKHGYGVVRDLVGHGLGTKLHEEPQVPNYGRRGRGKKVQNGLTIAIEPMINMGTEKVKQLDDNWTIVTQDGFYPEVLEAHPGATYPTWLFACMAQLTAGMLLLIDCFIPRPLYGKIGQRNETNS